MADDAAGAPCNGGSEGTDGGSDPEADSLTGPPLSKKQQRKLRKRGLQQLRKEEKRQERAAGADELKRKREAEWDALTEEERAVRLRCNAEARARRLRGRQEALEAWRVAYQRGPRVVIDMDFEDCMQAQEIRSLCQQVMYCWSIIRRAPAPVQLSLCGLRPDTQTRATLMAKAGVEKWELPMTAEPFHTQHPRPDSIVYLTADSPNVLHSLEADKVYVIGGIVDHNRHKSLTFNRAMANQCAHAQLPLADFLDLKSNNGKFSRVLTVNHMVAILTNFNETKDWQKAFLSAIPSRKDVQPAGKEEEDPTPGDPACPPPPAPDRDDELEADQNAAMAEADGPEGRTVAPPRDRGSPAPSPNPAPAST